MKKNTKSSKKHYENNKERLQEQANNSYKELSKEESNLKRRYGKNTFQNISDKNTQRLKEYQKNYSEGKKSI